MNLFLVIEAILPLWPIAAILFGALIALLIGLSSSPNQKTRRIVILGSSMSGKTTLWNQLRNRTVGSVYNPTTGFSDVESFTVKVDANEVKVLATKDIGGSDTLVKYYGELVNENGTFIYFLIDLMKLQGAKQEIRARLQLISKCIKDKNLKDCGFKIIATHFDQYEEDHKKRKENSEYMVVRQDAINDVLNILTDKKISDCKFNIDNSHIMVANLLDSFYIDEIKREITLEK